MTFHVGFFDLSKQVLVEVEEADFPADQVTMTSCVLTDLYRTCKHKLPSAVWVVFDEADTLRIFFLDLENPQGTDEPTLEKIKARVDWYRRITARVMA
jgi:hypothetical protein